MKNKASTVVFILITLAGCAPTVLIDGNDEAFCLRYKDGRLSTAYEDRNGDGVVDIILGGAF